MLFNLVVPQFRYNIYKFVSGIFIELINFRTSSTKPTVLKPTRMIFRNRLIRPNCASRQKNLPSMASSNKVARSPWKLQISRKRSRALNQLLRSVKRTKLQRTARSGPSGTSLLTNKT